MKFKTIRQNASKHSIHTVECAIVQIFMSPYNALRLRWSTTYCNSRIFETHGCLNYVSSKHCLIEVQLKLCTHPVQRWQTSLKNVNRVETKRFTSQKCYLLVMCAVSKTIWLLSVSNKEIDSDWQYNLSTWSSKDIFVFITGLARSKPFGKWPCKTEAWSDAHDRSFKIWKFHYSSYIVQKRNLWKIVANFCHTQLPAPCQNQIFKILKR